MDKVTFFVVLLVGQALGEMVTRAAFKLPPQYLQLVHLQPQHWIQPQVGRAATVLSLVYPMPASSPESEPQPNALSFDPSAVRQRNEIEPFDAAKSTISQPTITPGKRDSYSPFYGLRHSPVQMRVFKPLGPSLNPFRVYSQRRIQDEKGGYFFSYSGGPSSRSEHRDHQGVVRGSYSYADANGKVNTYNYIADHNGFRVTSDPTDPETSQRLSATYRSVPEFLYTRSKRDVVGYD